MAFTRRRWASLFRWKSLFVLLGRVASLFYASLVIVKRSNQ